MNFGGPGFVLAIIAMSMLAWIITTAIRARHGYPLTDDWGNAVHPTKSGSDETTKALVAENGQLKATVERLEERLKVLERIATDPSKRLSDEIDALALEERAGDRK
jgi:cell division protein FtsB